MRKEIAPKVLRQGTAWLESRRFEAVSERPVDWSQVAAGAADPPVRQLPGPANVMGRVKFMLPNPLGIYLHDTPGKGLFAAADRADSHGCVRLQHAGHLARWLFGRPIGADPDGPADQERDLAAPVPVYIVYLTAVPTTRGVAFAPDIYGRDRALMAGMARRRG